MQVTLFDPRLVDPQTYKDKYPELKNVAEYQELSYPQLIFIWWFANPTSPLVVHGVSDEERVAVALEKSKLRERLNAKDIERYANLNFPDDLKAAIIRTGHMEVDLRATARETFIDMFNNYQKIRDTKNFTDEDGHLDYMEYMKVSTMVSNELPKLIRKIEEGMGIIDVDGVPGLVMDDADSLLGSYVDSKK